VNHLYARIPATTSCKAGCNACCGPVPVSPVEARALGISGTMTPTKPNTTTCAFYENGCTVYDDRPFMCRLFGAANDAMLTCPHGVRALMPLSKADASRLTGEYRRGFS